jgi:hypothetical protein
MVQMSDVFGEVAYIADANGDMDSDAMVRSMTPDQQARYLAEINTLRSEMRMRPLTSVEDALRKYSSVHTGEGEDTSVRTRYATPGQVCGKGRVRKLSDAQLGYLNHLLSNRETSGLERLPGSEDITYMSLRGARDLIDRLLKCPVKAGQPTERMATEKQIAYALSLTVRKMGQAKADEVAETAKAMTMKDISSVIDKLKGMQDYTPVAPATPSEARTEPIKLEGMHKVGERIFKVQKAVHGSGHLYAKELIEGSFAYAQGAIRMLSAETKMSLADAKAYGVLYGVCCVCARMLTDENSIAAGIGPICASKF